MYIFNGRFLERRVTGVERFAREILLELDKIILPNTIHLAIPAQVKEIPDYHNIKVVQVGQRHGNLWEQLDLPRYAIKNKGLLINLCNTAPFCKTDIVCVHDMAIKAYPRFYSRCYVLWERLMLANIFKKAKGIITVSEFSKQEIIRYYAPKQKIQVIYNSWEHEERIQADDAVFQKFPMLKEKNYFFSMSSMAPNKNVRWIVETAKKNPDHYFVVSGNVNKKVFGDVDQEQFGKNFIYAGYLSDGEAKALMSKCKAFIFPTFYEGFGIPPMEAMSCGADAIVSDNDCMREIYGEHVAYIDPYVPCEDIEKAVLSGDTVQEKRKFLEHYSWKKSAERLRGFLQDIYED